VELPTLTVFPAKRDILSQALESVSKIVILASTLIKQASNAQIVILSVKHVKVLDHALHAEMIF